MPRRFRVPAIRRATLEVGHTNILPGLDAPPSSAVFPSAYADFSNTAT
jgi:hypothetical protein